MNRWCAFAMVALLQAAWIAGLTAESRQRDPSWVAPDRAASKPNPLAGRPELASGGRKIFEQRCAQCHGDDAQGTSRAPSLLSRRVQAETDGALFWKISSGDTRAGMPSFSYLPAPERWQLVLHLRSLAPVP
jgi:mono/diheme cytochrome c family protein